MDIVFLIGRILFGALFLAAAMGHLTQTSALAGYASSRGVSMATPATLVGRGTDPPRWPVGGSRSLG